jgi:hypothetical protein
MYDDFFSLLFIQSMSRYIFVILVGRLIFPVR